MTQQITISPVTRIEGHAKITIHLDDAGLVDQSYFHVEQFRGFEKFCEGRMYYEMMQITPRICGICPVSHHLASAEACDQIAGATPTPAAHKLREMMHMAQTIQSHAMHFFELAGPDLILGFDANPAVRNVAGLMAASPDLVVKAVKLRAFGQRIIGALGQRRVHPVFGVPGGVNKPLASSERDAILRELNQHITTALDGLSIFKDWAGKHQEIVDSFAVFSSAYMGLVGADGALELYHGPVRLVDAAGEQLELFEPHDYLDYIGEHVEPFTYLKFPFYRQRGWPDGFYRVGPLARLNVATHINTPLAQSEMQMWKSLNGGRPVDGTLYYHYARLIELVYALERLRELLDDPDILSKDLVGPAGTITGEGVGCLEAPRGTLFHHYWTDENGVIEKANLIVATGHNNWAMNRAVNMVAKRYVNGNSLAEGMLNRVEAAIRAFDPCLSCSTHAWGSMPLRIELYGADGERLDALEQGP
jgi:NAD-reducing hydrogenase large subunit